MTTEFQEYIVKEFAKLIEHPEAEGVHMKAYSLLSLNLLDIAKNLEILNTTMENILEVIIEKRN